MNRLQKLADEGQSIWLDNIDRAMLHNGDLEKRVAEDSLTGMTSNPTIFEKALAEGSEYDEQLANAPQGLTPSQRQPTCRVRATSLPVSTRRLAAATAMCRSNARPRLRMTRKQPWPKRIASGKLSTGRT